MVPTADNLGRLKKVDLRFVWESESSDFTPWLAKDENLKLLGDTIGIELECEAQEKRIGPFRADILCKDTGSDQWVLIENQLEKTDHSHLGQVLTYAAGLEAVTVVWIAERFTDEHRSALDWLNEHTDDSINFFGIEVELWQIGDSPIAPKFNLVCQPNEWSRTVAESAKQIQAGAISLTQQLQLQFWTGFREYLLNSKSFLKPQKPIPQHWMFLSIGRSGFQLQATFSVAKNQLGTLLVISGPNAKAYYDLLFADKIEIENEIQGTLEWDKLPEGKESRIRWKRDIPEAKEQDKWPEYHEWLRQKMEILHKSLSHRIKNLELPAEVESE